MAWNLVISSQNSARNFRVLDECSRGSLALYGSLPFALSSGLQSYLEVRPQYENGPSPRQISSNPLSLSWLPMKEQISGVP